MSNSEDGPKFDFGPGFSTIQRIERPTSVRGLEPTPSVVQTTLVTIRPGISITAQISSIPSLTEISQIPSSTPSTTSSSSNASTGTPAPGISPGAPAYEKPTGELTTAQLIGICVGSFALFASLCLFMIWVARRYRRTRESGGVVQRSFDVDPGYQNSSMTKIRSYSTDEEEYQPYTVPSPDEESNKFLRPFKLANRLPTGR